MAQLTQRMSRQTDPTLHRRRSSMKKKGRRKSRKMKNRIRESQWQTPVMKTVKSGLIFT